MNKITKNQSELQKLVHTILTNAKQKGASQAEVSVSQGAGYTATVRMGEIESIEHHQDRSLGITVYFGTRNGSVNTTDIDSAAVDTALDKACHIARLTNEDPCAGLADKEMMATDIPDLDLYHPWDLSVDRAIELAKEAEAAGRDVDKRITNSEGVSLTTYDGYGVYGNSHGFLGATPGSHHNLTCVLIAEEGGAKQRDMDYTVARAADDLVPFRRVAESAARRTLNRLGARRLKSQQCPVIFAAEVASGLLGCLIGAISGGNLYRRSSFLCDHLGKQIFPEFIHLYERPHLLKSLGSAPFDNEGVVVHDRDFISKGNLESYVLSSYSARKLGMKTTGNAGGVHNLLIDTGDRDLDGLLNKMGTGLLVTELIGHGINLVTGDYSRGAVGFWIEGGKIQFPVEEVTIAGNLREMFMGVVEVGNDVDRRGNTQTGSILIDRMTVGGV